LTVPLELLGRRLLVVASLELGRRSEAEAEMLAYRLRAENFRHPLYLWYVALWRATWALVEGRLEDCRRYNEQAAAEGHRAGSTNAYLLAATQYWCLLSELKDSAGIEALLSSADTAQIEGVSLRISAGLGWAQMGKLTDARNCLDAVEPQLSVLNRDSEWLPSMAQIAETVTLVGPHAITRPVYDALLPYRGLFVIEGIGAAVRGPVHLYLGLLARALGRRTEALEHLAAAIQAVRTFGAPQVLQRIERECDELRFIE
jgi:hypothetical protein